MFAKKYPESFNKEVSKGQLRNMHRDMTSTHNYLYKKFIPRSMPPGTSESVVGVEVNSVDAFITLILCPRFR